MTSLMNLSTKMLYDKAKKNTASIQHYNASSSANSTVHLSKERSYNKTTLQVCQTFDNQLNKDWLTGNNTVSILTRTWAETNVRELAAWVQSVTRKPRSRTTDHCW